MAKKPRVTVVLINYGDPADTLECLASLSRLRGSFTLDVVIVDTTDQAEDQELHKETILRAFPQVHVLLTANLGFTGGNNVGMKYALEHFNPDYVWLLNNDTTVEPQALANLLAAAERHGNSSVYIPKIYFSAGKEFHAQDYTKEERGKVLWYAGGFFDWANVYGWHRGVDEVDHGQFDEEEHTQFGAGTALLVPKEVLARVGLLNTKYFLYVEDVEYSLRVRKAGGSVWYVPEAVVWHKNAGSTGGSGSALHVYYQTRNRLVFGLKYAPLRTKLALMKESVKKLRKGKREERLGVRDALLGRMGRFRGNM